MELHKKTDAFIGLGVFLVLFFGGLIGASTMGPVLLVFSSVGALGLITSISSIIRNIIENNSDV